MANNDNHDENAKYMSEHMKYWRSWGSWFSWGLPVGLGLFLVAIAFATWLLSQAFSWK